MDSQTVVPSTGSSSSRNSFAGGMEPECHSFWDHVTPPVGVTGGRGMTLRFFLRYRSPIRPGKLQLQTQMRRNQNIHLDFIRRGVPPLHPHPTVPDVPLPLPLPHMIVFAIRFGNGVQRPPGQLSNRCLPALIPSRCVTITGGEGGPLQKGRRRYGEKGISLRV